MSSVSRVRAALAILVLDQADGLAGAERDRELDLGAQILWWTRHQHIAAIVVAKLEHLRRDFRTAAVTFAKVMIHNDSHRIAPSSFPCISARAFLQRTATVHFQRTRKKWTRGSGVPHPNDRHTHRRAATRA